MLNEAAVIIILLSGSLFQHNKYALADSVRLVLISSLKMLSRLVNQIKHNLKAVCRSNLERRSSIVSIDICSRRPAKDKLTIDG